MTRSGVAMAIIMTVDPRRLLRPLATLLVSVVLAGIVGGYHRYLPPDFEAEFLLGRQAYFFAGYQWAFYAHLAAGPASLALGLLLVSDRLRRRFPAWHRRLGRVLAVLVLGVLVPSGLWMSRYAISGAVAGAGFAALAVATGTTVGLGWRAAVRRHFTEHRLWMERCFLLLSSAVVLRLIAGVATLAAADADWLYPASAWASWLGPIAVHEAVRRRESTTGHPATG